MSIDAAGMFHDATKCDRCGTVESRGSRVGMTCNQGLPRGGYCDGTLQNAAYFASLVGGAAPRTDVPESPAVPGQEPGLE